MRTLRFSCFLLMFTSSALGQDVIPHLQRHGAATQLVVDGQPLIIRGGELGNSTGEPGYLRQFWPKLKALNLNAVIAPVYWDAIEPVEGKFDFATVDGVLTDARANNLRIVLLWFGSWKNSMSCYTPAWIKRDPARFPRVQDSNGRGQEILSPYSEVNRDTDARAFAALMRHLREFDGAKHTVVMVQVENEIGMIPEARDHSPAAEKEFGQPVPAELMTYLTKHFDSLTPELRARWIAAGHKPAGTWSEVFGQGPATDEVFAAWYFARYVDEVTRRGKDEYPLPMYLNAALIRPGYLPGQYPSAGPLPHLFDVWRAGCPSIDFFSPDIYFRNFVEWARRYTQSGNPLFIPEAQRGPDAAANGLYAIGALNAMGFSAFGIESISGSGEQRLTESYDVLAQLSPLIAEHQGNGTMVGLLSQGAEQKQPQEVWLGGYEMLVTFEHPNAPAGGEGDPVASGGLIIGLGEDEFLLAGVGVTATFPARGGEQIGILAAEEGRYLNGKWSHVRFLNGDETNQGRHIRIDPGHFGIQRFKLYRYR